MGETWRNAPRPQGQNCREHLESCFRPIHIGDICDINIMPQIVYIYKYIYICICVCELYMCVICVCFHNFIYNYISCMHKSEQFPCGPCLIIWVAWMLGLCMDHPAGHVEGQWSHLRIKFGNEIGHGSIKHLYIPLLYFPWVLLSCQRSIEHQPGKFRRPRRLPLPAWKKTQAAR